MEKERILYLHTPSVQVNSDYAIFNNQWRVEIDKIDAVFVTKQASYRRIPITIGIIFCFIGLPFQLWGCLVFGIVLFIIALLIPSSFVLRIKTGTGEIRPLTSSKQSELIDIKKAIERAIMQDSYYEYKPIEKIECIE